MAGASLEERLAAAEKRVAELEQALRAVPRYVARGIVEADSTSSPFTGLKPPFRAPSLFYSKDMGGRTRIWADEDDAFSDADLWLREARGGAGGEWNPNTPRIEWGRVELVPVQRARVLDDEGPTGDFGLCDLEVIGEPMTPEEEAAAAREHAALNGVDEEEDEPCSE